MGFARLAETSIRKIRGKSEADALGPMDKILASSICGALATWNQPIEVIRVEVRVDEFCRHYTCLRVCSDAIHVQECCSKCKSTCQAHYHEHACFHLQRKWYQGSLPWCHPSYWSWCLANCLYGFISGLCQSMVRMGLSYSFPSLHRFTFTGSRVNRWIRTLLPLENYGTLGLNAFTCFLLLYIELYCILSCYQ